MELSSADYYLGLQPRADADRGAGNHEFVVTKHRYSGFVSDCTASTSQAAHDATLFTMGRHFATVAASHEILARWSALPTLAAIQIA